MKTIAIALPMNSKPICAEPSLFLRLIIKLATSIENFFVRISPHNELNYEDYERLENKRTAHQMRNSSF